MNCDVSVVGYGIGNTGSIINMYRQLGVTADVVSTPEAVLSAKRLVLPGIGAFDACIAALEQSGLRPSLMEAIRSARPLLGICVGMQMLTRGSEEGALPGLGLIAATTRKFTQGENLKIPHMGWNAVQWQNLNSPLVRDLTDKARFYFVHSYYVSCDTPDISLATCTHGLQFSAAIAAGNIYGVQFHPEKSHTFGLRLLRNFLSV